MKLALAQHSALPRLGHPFAALSRLIALRRERHALLRLEQHMLDDIGLTRSEALTEAERPLWDAPQNWRQKA